MKLFVEGGATKTRGALIDHNGRVVEKHAVGPTNLHVVGEEGVYRNLLELISLFKIKPPEFHFYLSGMKTRKDRASIQKICRRLKLKKKIVIGNDLMGSMWKYSKDGTGIIVISGTGSAVYGRNEKGEESQVGGWGEKLGDEAGAYNIAIAGIKAAIQSYDGRGKKSTLENKFGKIECITDWIDGKTKTEIAGLAPVVFKAAREGDEAAEEIIDSAVDHLVKAVKIVERKVGKREIYLNGGNFKHQKMFGDKFIRQLEMFDSKTRTSANLVREMNLGDEGVVHAIKENIDAIASVAERTASAFISGGRLLYVGAGTSGRIAVMDAVECVPTFNVPKTMVQAIIAGGARALTESVEGAEDNEEAARKIIKEEGICNKDIVVGVSASGTNPFVVSALNAAKKTGAYTVLIASNADASTVANKTIIVDTGTEIIEGSSRLKAGTAAKMVLNMISTVSMMRCGKVFGNLMIDVKPTNKKLVKRAVGIIAKICGINEKNAAEYLERAKNETREAVRKGLWDKVGEILMCGFERGDAPKDTGGIIIFERNVKYLSKLRGNYFVAVDQEGGRVNRIKDGVTMLPPMKNIKDKKEAYKYGEILAKELLALGVNIDLAPVSDVNTEEKNPIIGDRSFGHDTKRVSELSSAMIKGMQDNGLLACSKHFPGHGPTKRDSHKCLPKVNISLKEWEEVHLPPFIEAIKSGVSSIMMGHIFYPVLDKELPTSLSYKVVTGILRDRLGFSGVIITDDLGMGAITKHYTPEEAAVMAINAGVDIVLICHGEEVQNRVRNAIVNAILDGKISIDRINESIERVKEMKSKGA